MVTRRRAIVALGMVCAALLGAAARVDAHPLHTTLTELTINPTTHAVRATIRLFSDDLSGVLSRRRRDVKSDADVAAYLAGSFSVLDRGGRVVALRGCGVKRSGDVLWVCVEGDATDELSLRNAVLCDTFSDQVNIVQVTRNSDKRTVLFTRGDGPKRLF